MGNSKDCGLEDESTQGSAKEVERLGIETLSMESNGVGKGMQ